LRIDVEPEPAQHAHLAFERDVVEVLRHRDRDRELD